MIYSFIKAFFYVCLMSKVRFNPIWDKIIDKSNRDASYVSLWKTFDVKTQCFDYFHFFNRTLFSIFVFASYKENQSIFVDNFLI